MIDDDKEVTDDIEELVELPELDFDDDDYYLDDYIDDKEDEDTYSNN